MPHPCRMTKSRDSPCSKAARACPERSRRGGDFDFPSLRHSYLHCHPERGFCPGKPGQNRSRRISTVPLTIAMRLSRWHDMRDRGCPLPCRRSLWLGVGTSLGGAQLQPRSGEKCSPRRKPWVSPPTTEAPLGGGRYQSQRCRDDSRERMPSTDAADRLRLPEL